jgi:hypothetical protein
MASKALTASQYQMEDGTGTVAQCASSIPDNLAIVVAEPENLPSRRLLGLSSSAFN